MGDRTYPEHVMLLEPGDRLVLYSDGISEAMSPDSEPFGSKRLLDSLSLGRTLPLDESLATLWRDIETWRGAGLLQDDASVIAVEITARP